ncbi:hypothetical protein [Leifsonia sp. Leaf264]|nr:hypothetical protein [Leifsonia sp. Leaf264]
MSDDISAAATTTVAPLLKPLLLPMVTDAAAPVCEGDSCSF